MIVMGYGVGVRERKSKVQEMVKEIRVDVVEY